MTVLPFDVVNNKHLQVEENKSDWQLKQWHEYQPARVKSKDIQVTLTAAKIIHTI